MRYQSKQYVRWDDLDAFGHVNNAVYLTYAQEARFAWSGILEMVVARAEVDFIAPIYDGDTFIDIEPYKVNAVDTNGAGDMFAGAFLYAITNGRSYADAGKLASLASSKVVTQFGPRLEWHQAKEVLNHMVLNK